MTSYKDILRELVNNYYYNFKQYKWYDNSDKLVAKGSICFVVNYIS